MSRHSALHGIVWLRMNHPDNLDNARASAKAVAQKLPILGTNKGGCR